MKQISAHVVEHPDVIITSNKENQPIVMLRIVAEEKNNNHTLKHYCYLYEEALIEKYKSLKKDTLIHIKGEEKIIEKFGTKYRSVQVADISSEQEKEQEKKQITLKGNLVKDVEINTYKKDEQEFQIAKFTIAVNEEGKETKFHNCNAYNEQIDHVKHYKKGDFVSVKGYEKISKVDDKTYINFILKNSHMIKAKEHNREEELEEGEYFSKQDKEYLKELIEDKLTQQTDIEMQM